MMQQDGGQDGFLFFFCLALVGEVAAAEGTAAAAALAAALERVMVDLLGKLQVCCCSCFSEIQFCAQKICSPNMHHVCIE